VIVPNTAAISVSVKSRIFLFLPAVTTAMLAAMTAAPGAEPTTSGSTPAQERLWQREHFSSGWDGARAALADRGVDLTLAYTAEGFANVSGGRRRGAAYGGLLELGLDADLEKLAGWRGGRFHVNAIYPHGTNFTGRYVPAIATISSISAYDCASLFELWIEQDFWEGALSLRAGQLGADLDFWVTETAALFINDAFGTPSAPSANLPLPIYPITALGARLRVEPWKGRYLLLGAYDGNGAPAVLGDASPDAAGTNEFNHFGTHWALRRDEGAVLIAELGAQFNQPEDEETAPAAAMRGEKAMKPGRGLASSFKLGIAYHTDSFSDVRDTALAELGSSLARESARAREGNWAIYAVAEQELFRERGSQFEGLRAFARAAFAPEDRNVIEHTLQGGLRYAGLFPGRDEDEIGIAVTCSRVSNRLRDAVRDARRADGTRLQDLDYEAVIELTCRIHLTPWLTVQPDLQYVIHPGGSDELGNAFVAGLRTAIAF
jgi:porin